MSNTNRKIIDSYDYKNIYKVEVFDTGYTVVFRKTDDQSTAEINYVGRASKVSEGHTVVLTIENFLKHYNTHIMHTILELLEGFLQKAEIKIRAKTGSINLSFQENYYEFLTDVLNNETYSKMKKWCLLSSVLQEAPSFASLLNKEPILEILESQIDPEKVAKWTSLEQSSSYIYPTFPNLNNILDDYVYKEAKRLFTRKVNVFNEYITAVNLLKNKDCSTLQEAKEIGFMNYPERLSEKEEKTIGFYALHYDNFKEFESLTAENLFAIQELFPNVFVSPLNKELFGFAVNQILEKDLHISADKQSLKVFLPRDEYDHFKEITDPPMENFPILNVPLKKIEKLNSYLLKDWMFWLAMAKIFSETDNESFSYFFSEWISLIEEERGEYSFQFDSNTMALLNPGTINRYFNRAIDEGVPVRYLWYIEN